MGKISRAHVSFRIIDDALKPTLITTQLGITPTFAHTKGEMSPPGRVTGRSFRRRTGVWGLTSPLPETAELDDHLRALLDQLDPRATAIRAYRDQGYTVDFFCGLFLDSDNEGLEVPHDTLARVAALGATLGLDIYALLPDDDEPAATDGSASNSR